MVTANGRGRQVEDANDFKPIRPIFLVSSMEHTPTTSEEKTRGTISILIRLMKTVPIGLMVSAPSVPR